MTLLLLACVTEQPCVEGYGRSADGSCVALRTDNAESEGNTSTSDEAPDGEGGEEDDGSYLLDEPEEEGPVLSLGELEQGIAEALAASFTLDPEVFHDLYGELVNEASMDDDCPYLYDYYYESYGRVYWYDSCTSDNGTTYAGYGIHSQERDYVDASSGYEYSHNAYFSGSAKVVSPSGSTLEAAGYSSTYAFYYPSYDRTYSYASIVGTFRWDGTGADASWLGQDLAVDLYTYAIDYQSYEDGVYTYLNGSLSGFTGTVNAVWFDQVLLQSEDVGSDCGAEPGGLISVRDEAGDWYDVVFDGATYSGGFAFGPDCDGCGEAWFHGAPLGEVCPDFTALQGWEGRPW